MVKLTTQIALIAGVAVDTISAHGAQSFPPSRQWECSGGATPNLGIQWGGTGGDKICLASNHNKSINHVIVNWSGVGIGHAQGHRTLDAYKNNPQGPHIAAMVGGRNAHVCSGGMEPFSALDSTVWTKGVEGGKYPIDLKHGKQEFEYKSSAPHTTFGKGYIDLYITADGWDPNLPVTWNSLEPKPFCSYYAREGVKFQNTETFDCTVPSEKTGKHVIFSVWQRDDSDEAFYSCSDVNVVTGDGSIPVTKPPAPADATTTVSQPTTTRPAGHQNDMCAGSFKYNVVYLSYKVDWARGIDYDIKTAVDAGFNVLMLAFLEGASGPVPEDAFIAWNELTKDRQTAALEYAHKHGARIMLSIGGAEDHLDEVHATAGFGEKYGKMAAQAAIDSNLDGIDFDVELRPGNSAPFMKKTMQNFLAEATKTARDMLPQSKGFLISHAPMAPYASVWAGEGNGYRDWMLKNGEMVDFISLQYYNQGSYPTTDSTFESSIQAWSAGSTVKELIDAGLPANKLVVGKPINLSTASVGYIAPETIHAAACEFKKANGWQGGFMTWMYDVNKKSESVAWAGALNALCPGETMSKCGEIIPLPTTTKSATTKPETEPTTTIAQTTKATGSDSIDSDHACNSEKRFSLISATGQIHIGTSAKLCAAKEANRLTTSACSTSVFQKWEIFNGNQISRKGMCFEAVPTEKTLQIELKQCEPYKQAQIFEYDSHSGRLHPALSRHQCVRFIEGGRYFAVLPCDALDGDESVAEQSVIGEAIGRASTTTVAATTAKVNCDTVKCVEPHGFYKHCECNKFWQCGHGIPYMITCPKGLLWNHKALACDWARNVTC